MGFPKLGLLCGGSREYKDYSILGSLFGSPSFGRLPNGFQVLQQGVGNTVETSKGFRV